MPRSSAVATPKYRHHRATGRAVVTLNGRDHYLGPHGSKASRVEYDRLIAESLARGRRSLVDGHDTTVVELVAAYVKFAKGYYDGNNEYNDVVLSLRPLKKLYARMPAVDFSPLKLKAVRQAMIEANLSRGVVNQRIGRIKRMFRWAVENELVPPSVYHGLSAVRGLSRGRSGARETEPVKPVPEAFVDALKSHLPPQLWAMVELQRFTGTRPGEVTAMRTCDLDTGGKVWTYTPADHKNAWRGHQRTIYLGPRAQAVLAKWLRTDLEAYLFQPAEAMEWRRQQRAASRTTPLSCGNRRGTNRRTKPKRVPTDRYQTHAYQAAIRKACIAAEVPHWHPKQLRHNAATWLRKEFNLDVARGGEVDPNVWTANGVG